VKKKVTILHIDTEKYWRGGQRQAVYLHRELLKSGWNSILLCPPYSKTETFCLEESIPVVSLKMRHEADLYAALKISGIVKKEKISIIVAHTAKALSLSFPSVKKNKFCKLVAVRRVNFHIGKNRLSRWKYSNNLLSAIVSVSESVKKVLIEDGISEEKISVIHDGIDLNKYINISSVDGLKKKLQIDEKNIVIGTVAALEDSKDYTNLLHAAKLVLRQNSRIVFIAVGGGKDEEKLKALHHELALGDRFKFVGYHQEVGQFFKLFDIFILSSKREGLGSSLLDAMSVGNPVIGTNAGGIPEIIQNGKNGLLVEKEYPQALAQAIIKLAGNEDLRKKLSDEGLKYVQNFSIGNITKKYLRLFDALYKQ